MSGPNLKDSNRDREWDNFLQYDNETHRRVIVGNGESDPVPVYLTEGPIAEQTPLYLSFEGDTIPGTTQTLITMTVPALKKRKLYSVLIVNRFMSRFKIKLNGTTIGSGATGPGETNVKFEWAPVSVTSAGQVVDVELTTQSNVPASQIEAFLMCVEEDA